MRRIAIILLAAIALGQARYVPLNQFNEIDSSPIFDLQDHHENTEIRPTAVHTMTVVTQTVPSVCLRIAPHLPPCNFEKHAARSDDEGIESSGHAEGAPIDSGVATPALPGFPALPAFSTFEGNAEKGSGDQVRGQADGLPPIMPSRIRNLNGRSTVIEKDPAITIIYKLEGCLPSRLPFKLPPCPIEDSSRKSIEVHKLFPFKLPGVQDALIFPEIDIKQIVKQHKRMKGKNRNRNRPIYDQGNSDETRDGEFASDENLIESSEELPSDEVISTNFNEGYRRGVHASGYSDGLNGEARNEDGDSQMKIVEPSKQNAYHGSDSKLNLDLTEKFMTNIVSTTVGTVGAMYDHRFSFDENFIVPKDNQPETNGEVHNSARNDAKTFHDEVVKFQPLEPHNDLQGTRYDIIKGQDLSVSNYIKLQNVDSSSLPPTSNDFDKVVTAHTNSGENSNTNQYGRDEELLTEEELEDLMAELGDLETELTYSKLLSKKSQDVVTDVAVENKNLV